MKIALIGYGKMGKTIERIALERGHDVVARLEETPNQENINQADVAIEFTFPESAFINLKNCIDLNLPVVSGTTGWTEKLPEIKSYCELKNGSFIYASNYSLGVNLFFELNHKLAQLMKNHSNYQVEMEEVHHTEKKDAPSGTAISLANDIIKEYNFSSWNLDQPTTSNELGIYAKRIENVPGTHTITYSSKEDYIKIEHLAHTRDGFALGAVIAAEYIHNKKGVFTMKDVLGI